MNIVLKHQVDASELAAAEIEKEIENRKLSLSYEIQSLLKGLVGHAVDLREIVDAGHARAARREPYLDDATIREIDVLYQRLDSLFDRAHHIIENVKRFSEYTIEGKEKFYLTWSELRGITCFSLDSVLRANNQADRGEGRELSEFMNELHH